MKSIAKSVMIPLVVSLVCPSVSSAQGGREGGNGGGAYVCPDPTRSELVDLFEARLNGLKIERSAAPISDQRVRALERLKQINEEMGKRVEAILAENETQKRPIPEDTELPFPSDVHARINKAGCVPRGAALYFDDLGVLSWDQALVAALPNTDQAALDVHEAVYRYLRLNRNDSTSEQARLYVGYLFSDMPVEYLQKVGIFSVSSMHELRITPEGKISTAHFDRKASLSSGNTKLVCEYARFFPSGDAEACFGLYNEIQNDLGKVISADLTFYLNGKLKSAELIDLSESDNIFPVYDGPVHLKDSVELHTNGMIKSASEIPYLKYSPWLGWRFVKLSFTTTDGKKVVFAKPGKNLALWPKVGTCDKAGPYCLDFDESGRLIVHGN